MYDLDKVQYGRNIFPHGVEGGQVSNIGFILTPFWCGGFFLEVQPFFNTLIKETLVDG
jgi:hypothetical protein